jgi:hypothetical protein
MTPPTLYRVLGLALLAAMGAQRYLVDHRSPDVTLYHERIRAAADRVPSRIGPWIGQDSDVPAQALTVLKPNVLISRRYVNVESGITGGVLLVHCSDAHHMVGHFPLRCYPARGWDVRGSEPRDWTVGGIRLTGMEYQFTRQTRGGEEQSLVVANCLLRPAGRTLRNMEELSATLTGNDGTSSGAGQVQVFFPSSVPAEQREEAIGILLEGYRPLLEAILAKPEK